MIILKNNSILLVQDKIYRDFSGFKHNTSSRVVRNIIFKMTKVVVETL